MTFKDAVWIGLGIKIEPADTIVEEMRPVQQAVNHLQSARMEAMNFDPLTSREQAEHEDRERQDDWAEAQHTALLESYVRHLWVGTLLGTGPVGRSLAHRLEMIARRIHNVDRYGVKNNNEDDYKTDLLLEEWGAGKLIAYFGALAETESTNG